MPRHDHSDGGVTKLVDAACSRGDAVGEGIDLGRDKGHEAPGVRALGPIEMSAASRRSARATGAASVSTSSVWPVWRDTLHITQIAEVAHVAHASLTGSSCSAQRAGFGRSPAAESSAEAALVRASSFSEKRCPFAGPFPWAPIPWTLKHTSQSTPLHVSHEPLASPESASSQDAQVAREANPRWIISAASSAAAEIGPAAAFAIACAAAARAFPRAVS